MKDKLTARRQQAERLFDELLKERENHEGRIKEIDTELNRLQGEWRLIEDLLKKEEEKVVSPKPNVIDVDGATKGAKK